MNEEQLKAVDAALLQARKVGGTYQAALLRVAVSMTTSMRGIGCSPEAIKTALDSLAVLIAAPRPDPVELVDRHDDLLAGLGMSLRLLADDKEITP